MSELVLALCLSIPILGMSDYKNKKACEYIPQILESSQKHDIEPEILISLIFVESSFSRKVVSNKGACGLTQVIPRYTGKPALRKKYTCNQLKNSTTSIKVGAKVLSWWIEYHEENVARALCGYNAGFRCGKKKGTKPLKAAMKYARKVLNKAKLIKDKKNSILNN